MYEVRRGDRWGDKNMCRFSTKTDAINWVLDTIMRNGYKYVTTVNMNMDPVWIITETDYHSRPRKIFYITEE